MSTLTAAEWNERYPIGTPVLSWVMVDRSDEPLLTRTRSVAWELGDGTPVVSVAGRTGGYTLTCTEPLFTDEQRLADGWLDPAAVIQLHRQVVTANGFTAELRARVDAARAERGAAFAEMARALTERDELDQQWLAASCNHRDPESVDLWHGQPCPTCTAQQRVIDAARAWRHAPNGVGSWNEGRTLIDAIDALDNPPIAIAEPRPSTSWLNPDGTHRYMATACIDAERLGRPELHRECQVNTRRYDGTHKHGSHCKWCDAMCVCGCHTKSGTAVPTAAQCRHCDRPIRPRDTGTWLDGDASSWCPGGTVAHQPRET